MIKKFILKSPHALFDRVKKTVLINYGMQMYSYMILLLLVSCYSKEPEKTMHKGELMPRFNMLLADSSTYLNSRNLARNKPVVLFYFGPHCPYSGAQIEDITDDMKKLEEIQFVLLTTAPFSQMKRFYEEHKLNKFPNIVTGVDYDNFFVNYFRTQGVPYLAIYDRDKHLKAAFEGQTPIWQIKDVAGN